MIARKRRHSEPNAAERRVVSREPLRPKAVWSTNFARHSTSALHGEAFARVYKRSVERR